MIIAIDSGNTSIKAGIYEKDKLVRKHMFTSEGDLIRMCNSFPEAIIVISSVNQANSHLQNLLDNKKRLFIVDNNTAVPINNLYKTPQTLGIDRLAAVTGANGLYPNQDCLVIDAGTCITYDAIEKNAKYYGGSISPGLKMRFQALNHFTARLPLIETPKEKIPLIGTSTKEGIQSGVVNGLAFEIDGIIETYKKKYPELKVLMCGGDAIFFETKIKESIFVVPELVLYGLVRIYLHNA